MKCVVERSVGWAAGRIWAVSVRTYFQNEDIAVSDQLLCSIFLSTLEAIIFALTRASSWRHGRQMAGHCRGRVFLACNSMRLPHLFRYSTSIGLRNPLSGLFSFSPLSTADAPRAPPQPPLLPFHLHSFPRFISLRASCAPRTP